MKEEKALSQCAVTQKIGTGSPLQSTTNPQKRHQVLRRWILHNAELHAELIHLGYQDRNHIFTPAK